MPPEEVKRLLAGSELASPMEQLGIALLLLKGERGFPLAPERGQHLLRASAESGFFMAQSCLALAYWTDAWGTQQNHDDEAVQWASKAAEQGEVIIASQILAAAFAEGRGVARDDVQAITWSMLCKKRHMLDSDAFEALEARLTPAQQAEAQRRAESWRAAHRPKAPAPLPTTVPIETVMRTAHAMTFKPGDPGPRIVTKLAGIPWWPKGKPRPHCDKKHPMGLLAQIRLSDVPALRGDPGLLSFHYCDVCAKTGHPAWGSDPGDHPEGMNLTLFAHPSGLMTDGLGVIGKTPYGPQRVTFQDLREVPVEADDSPGSAYTSTMDTVHLESEDFAENKDVRAPKHYADSKIGGWPTWDQGGRTPECEEHRPMVFVGQLSSDLSMGLLWGGGGHAFLFVCPQACKHRRTCLIIQTT